jgi:Fur family iron response transcriptional regulator
LHQFTAAGLLREVVVEPGRSYFDTNNNDHHHFFCESTGMLQDIPGEAVSVGQLPHAPAGTEIKRVDVIIRIRRQVLAEPSA